MTTKPMLLEPAAYFTILRHCWAHTANGGINGEWGVHMSDMQFFGALCWIRVHRLGTLGYSENNAL